MNRRQFFKALAATAAAGTAAVVAPAVVPAVVVKAKRPGLDKMPTYKGVPFFYKDRLVLGSCDHWISWGDMES
ncbi:MAG: twin-arginine translocation signal domain-containing protein [Ketobacter sp.]|nr:twin-arginine translocation signal domain-containing protein [Ketobacter sp.]